MASLRQIRRRMRSIENIHDITKAMEMIAAFRFKKAEGRYSKSRVYLQEMEKLVSNLASSLEEVTNPFFEQRPVRSKALVLLTGDKGLCGAYNSNLIRAASQWLKENGQFDAHLVPVGKMGYEFFRKRQVSFPVFYPERAMVDLEFSRKLTADLKNLFLAKKADTVDILYTAYRPGGMGQIRVMPFLGLGYLLKDTARSEAMSDYLYEPSFEAIFEPLVQRFLEGKIYLCLLESLTSEYSARMVAMKQATENGEEVLEDLVLLRNKTRQATITRELSEIVGGASILL